MTDAHYLEPGWFTRNVFNRAMAGLTRLGVGLWGARTLQVRGRTSGEIRETPVNPLTVDGRRYLVAARGTTQWVRNLRSAGEGGLRLGRRVESFSAVEVPEAERPPILRAYLKKWKFEVGAFFDGVGPDSDDAEFRRIAPDHPVFRITTPGTPPR